MTLRPRVQCSAEHESVAMLPPVIVPRIHPLTGLPLLPAGHRADGRLIWPVLGGAPDDGGDGGQGDGQGGETPPPTFTQDEVNRMTTRSKNEGERHALRGTAFELGFVKPDGQGGTTGDIDAMKAAAQAQRDARRNAESDAERITREANEAKQQADTDRAAAARERHEAAVERALHRANVSDDLLGDAALLVQVDPGADADTIKTAVEAVKQRHPAMFGAAVVTPPPNSDPGRQPAGRTNGGSAPFGQAGRDRAQRDFGSRQPAA